MLQNVYGTTWDSLVQKRLSCDGKAATIVVNDSSNETFLSPWKFDQQIVEELHTH